MRLALHPRSPCFMSIFSGPQMIFVASAVRAFELVSEVLLLLIRPQNLHQGKGPQPIMVGGLLGRGAGRLPANYLMVRLDP